MAKYSDILTETKEAAQKSDLTNLANTELLLNEDLKRTQALLTEVRALAHRVESGDNLPGEVFNLHQKVQKSR